MKKRKSREKEEAKVLKVDEKGRKVNSVLNRHKKKRGNGNT